VKNNKAAGIIKKREKKLNRAVLRIELRVLPDRIPIQAVIIPIANPMNKSAAAWLKLAPKIFDNIFNISLLFNFTNNFELFN
jgi:hypothetical protein